MPLSSASSVIQHFLFFKLPFCGSLKVFPQFGWPSLLSTSPFSLSPLSCADSASHLSRELYWRPAVKSQQQRRIGSFGSVRSRMIGKASSADDRVLVTSSSTVLPERERTVDHRKIKFCSQCGEPTVSQVPSGDERERDVCSDSSCNFVHYTNPKLVVGAICFWEGKVLLCKRAIEPCRGRWGIPQGFMEMGESAREGAAREVMEEAGAIAELGPLLAVYNVPGQVQLLYLGRLKSSYLSPGIESLEARLVAWEEIADLDLAFPTVGWALEYAKKVMGQAEFVPQQRVKILGEGGPASGSFMEEAPLWKPLISKF